MESREILKRAHIFWREGREMEAAQYLKEAVNAAREEKENGNLIAILNEYGGALRVIGHYAEAVEAFEEAKAYCEGERLKNKQPYAMTLMNLANTYREAKNRKKAREGFEEAKKICDALGLRDYSYIGLLNNYALLLLEEEKAKEAEKIQLEAISLLEGMTGYDVPLAISYNNLYEIYQHLGDTKEAEKYLVESEAIVKEKLGIDHPLYAAVLNNRADFCMRQKNHIEAARNYLKAMNIIEKKYGKESQPWRVIQKNLQILSQTMKKPENGLERARKLAERVVDFIQENHVEVYKNLSVGLVGKGSECYGYDDEFSRDHDSEDRCMIFLDDETYFHYGAKIAKCLKEKFREKIEIWRISTFYRLYTAYSEGPRTMEEYRKVEEEYLSAATNGEVFLDNRGDFTRIRNRLLEHYPRDLWLKRLAYHLNFLAQSGQYNYQRVFKRKDKVALQLTLNEFVQHYIQCIHLINRKYTPFYKWSAKSLEALPIMGKQSRVGLEVLIESSVEQREKEIEKLCQSLVDYLHREGMTRSEESFLTVQADEVFEKIQDQAIREGDKWTK